MKISFNKYHGTGNDFIMIDNRLGNYTKTLTPDVILQLCHRRFGIGGDGLILLEKSSTTDFKMVYFNADGHIGSMCGNGGRCIVQFAHHLGIIDTSTCFEAYDGLHYAEVRNDGFISLGMSDVNHVETLNKNCQVLDTGSPHYVKFSDAMPEDINQAGKDIRYSQRFKDEGINVNFVVRNESTLDITTYERGVEAETYSCGTGVVASAIASVVNLPSADYHVRIRTKGGNLEVKFTKTLQGTYQNIQLMGSAIKVFEGTINIGD